MYMYCRGNKLEEEQRAYERFKQRMLVDSEEYPNELNGF